VLPCDPVLHSGAADLPLQCFAVVQSAGGRASSIRGSQTVNYMRVPPNIASSGGHLWWRKVTHSRD
jgi:hypothetical protein